MWIQHIFLLAYDLLVGGVAGMQRRCELMMNARQRKMPRGRQTIHMPLLDELVDWQVLTAWGLIFSAALWMCFLPLTLMVEPMNQTSVGKQQLSQHQVIQAFPQVGPLEEDLLGLESFSPKQRRKLSNLLAHTAEAAETLPMPELTRSRKLTHLTFPPVLLNHSELSQMIGTRRLARRLGKNGQVVAQVLVDEKGEYVNHKITRSDSPIFLLAVEQELRHLVFLPAIQSGTPTDRWTEVRFHFLQ